MRLGAALVLTVVVGLAGCGNDPVPVPNLNQMATPNGVVPYTVPGGDVSFSYPGDWALIPRDPPGVVTAASGGASVTVWAYRTVAVVPNPAAAAKTLPRLVASVKRRDPNFVVTKTAVGTVSKAPAIEIDGGTRIGGRPIEIRSVHIYRGLGEYVVDALADPGVFERANREAFQPFLLSLKVSGHPRETAQGTSSPGPSTPTTGTTTTGG